VTARFYFHLMKGRQRLLDRIGVELSEQEVMSPSALDLAKDIWPGLEQSDDWSGWSIVIVDADDRVVRVIALVE